LAAYVVSFLTILIFWVNHHTLFQSVRRADRALLFVNGLLLLTTSFISFSTAVLGRALQAGAYSRSAAVLYAITLGLASATFTGLWLVLRARPGLLTGSTPGSLRSSAPTRLRCSLTFVSPLVARSRPTVNAALKRSLVGPALYTVAAILALFSAPVSLLLDALIAGYFALLPRHLRRAAQPPENTLNARSS
jgi:hypothetical protein